MKYHENFEWDDRLLIIIMEYVAHGDLGKAIHDDGVFPEYMAQTMSRQLLDALGYLHANSITHRDVKPDNILIESMNPLVVKLTDFGLSKMVDTAETFLRTFCGTLLYCAPEVYTEYAEYDDNGVRSRGKRMRRMPGQRYNHAVDIWSLGGVLFYTLTGSPPYPVQSGISHSELLHKVMTTDLNVAPLHKVGVTQQGIDFLLRMLQRRPEHRATIPELETHPWLTGGDPTIQASQSYDEITDDEDMVIEPSQFRPPVPAFDDDDRISDSMSDASDKENSAMRHETQQPRLFGEVGNSAIGSSGVIPADYLNLPVEDHSMGATEIMDSHENEAYDSGGSGVSSTVRNPRHFQYNTTSIYPNQSADQLQSLVEDVASQSLGGPKRSIVDNLEPSQGLSHSVDPNSSKRKPVSNDTSEEFDENTPPGKPIIKRLKSEVVLDDVSEEEMREFILLARVPQIERLEGRSSDRMIGKRTFWTQDKSTWHLRYPEMTQLQYDAFSKAAADRGEKFALGETPLWDLAMKYFPPSPAPDRQNGRSTLSSAPGLKRDVGKGVNDTVEFPPTAPPVESQSMPDTAPPDSKIVVPIHHDKSANRAVAIIETDPSSCVKGIAFPITESFVSFGRGLENTETFQEKQEPRVPKNAFKILLWRDGYDPSKGGLPWIKDMPGEEESSYHFWISSKATLGIRINGYNVASSDSKNPSGPSQYWAKIYDGDSIMIWGGQDPKNQTTVLFNCLWGGSSKRRAENKQLELASPSTAHKLDAACQRVEKRMLEVREKNRKKGEATADDLERQRGLDRERENSRTFEHKIQEAVDFLAARHALTSRKGSGSRSPASMPTTALPSKRYATPPQPSRLSPDKNGGNAGIR